MIPTVRAAGELVDLRSDERVRQLQDEGFRQKLIESKDGTGIYFLSSTITSPTLARQWKAVAAAYPKAKLVQYDPALAGTFFSTISARSSLATTT